MLERKAPGAIVNIASAAGLYPTPFGPIYAASKGKLHIQQCAIRRNT
jgi:short-subunit dehydrogenase